MHPEGIARRVKASKTVVRWHVSTEDGLCDGEGETNRGDARIHKRRSCTTTLRSRCGDDVSGFNGFDFE